MRNYFSKISFVCLSLGAFHTAHADYEDGVNAAFNGNFDLAFHEFSVAAEEGLDLAQYNLAILYFMGQGVEKDVASAFKWTKAAAEQGHTAAQYNLGSLYFSGDGTDEDVDQAVHWYSEAAAGGHPEAAYLLAKMYQEGEGVKQDLVLAHAWASSAINSDHPEAADVKVAVERRMNAAQLSEAKRLFARWQIQ
jgi:uncharacterized protein